MVIPSLSIIIPSLVVVMFPLMMYTILSCVVIGALGGSILPSALIYMVVI